MAGIDSVKNNVWARVGKEQVGDSFNISKTITDDNYTGKILQGLDYEPLHHQKTTEGEQTHVWLVRDSPVLHVL